MNSVEVAKKGKAPSRVIIAPPSWFAGEWVARPMHDVAIGIRTLSAQQKNAVVEAALQYTRDHRDPSNDTAVYNEAVVYLVAAAGMCDPNDSSEPYELFPAAEDQVFVALTNSGAKAIYDAVIQLEAETSPYTIPATAEQVVRTLEYFNRGVFDVVDDVAKLKILKLVTILRETIEAAAPAAFIDDVAELVVLTEAAP